MEVLYIITTILSLLAAVLAWFAKILWAKEHTAAKEEIIKSKEAQIELLNVQIDELRNLNPIKIREYFLSVKSQLEEYNDFLKSQLDDATKKLERNQKTIKDNHSSVIHANDHLSIQKKTLTEFEELELKRLKSELGLANLERMKAIRRSDEAESKKIELEIERTKMALEFIRNPPKANFSIPNMPDDFKNVLSDAQSVLQTWEATVGLKLLEKDSKTK